MNVECHNAFPFLHYIHKHVCATGSLWICHTYEFMTLKLLISDFPLFFMRVFCTLFVENSTFKISLIMFIVKHHHLLVCDDTILFWFIYPSICVYVYSYIKRQKKSLRWFIFISLLMIFILVIITAHYIRLTSSVIFISMFFRKSTRIVIV